MKNLGKGLAVAFTAMAALGAIAIIKQPQSVYALIAPVVVAMFAWANNNGE